MRLSEVIFQGIFGLESRVRLRFDEDLSRVDLPEGVSFDEARAVIFNLLYPTDRRDEERTPLERSSEPKLALIFEVGGDTFRIVRKKPQKSVTVQHSKDGGYRRVASGASEVDSLLDEQLGRPSVRRFRALNTWDFEAAVEAPAADYVDPSELGPQAEKMVEEYEQTLEIDEIDQKLEAVEQKVEALREKYGRGLEVEEKLERARQRLEEIEISQIDDEDLRLLQNKKRRLDKFEEELQRLDRDEANERKKVSQLEPETPWQNSAMWVGLALGVVTIALSFVDMASLRWVALFDSVGFGIVAWIFLKYLTDREKVNIHKVRIESIKRRISEVRREKVEFLERIDHLLVHANAKSEMELINRQQKADRLEKAVEEYEQKSEQLAGNEQYQKARRRLETLEERRESLQARRDALPSFGADLFQLENELRAMGIDAKSVVRARKAEQKDPDEMSEFELLRDVTEELGYWTAGALDEKLCKLWQKMAAHILGGEFKDVDLDEDGKLEVPGFSEGDDLESWLENRPHEALMLSGTLALALQIRSSSNDKRVETLVLAEPRDRHPAALAGGLIEVFRGAAKHVHFALLSEA